MRRRSLLAAAAGAAFAPGAVPGSLARPALAQPASARTLVFVPQSNLTSLDPVWTTATVTRNYAYLVFDTLYANDADLRPQPQMAEGSTSEDGGKRVAIRLREGLRFHDGAPVLARDCVASLQRWMRRDPLGSTVGQRLDALEAPDDRTLLFRMKQAFPPLLYALGKTQPSPAVVMPERIARTDPFKQIDQVVGSGPFRFVADEYVSGSRAVFARFDAYQPRQEAPSGVAGGKQALVDRVEWRIVPEAATAAGALQSGEVDWLEMPLTDLLPALKRDRNVVVDRLDPYGLYPVLRFNHLHPPTSNRGLRQAILAALDPVEVMQAVMGDDSKLYNAPLGCFLPGTPYANDAAMDRVANKKPASEIAAMLKASGYAGEKLVLLHPTDQPFYDAMSQVVAATLKRIGVQFEDAAMDWGTVVQRRASKEPLDKGGWSLFCTSFPALDWVDPLAAPALRGNGPAAWYGWPTDERIESLRTQWIDAEDEGSRKRLAAEIQQEAFTEALFVPLGQYFQSGAWRRTVTGQLKAPLPVFWNVRKG